VHLLFHSVIFLTQNRRQKTPTIPILAIFGHFRVFKYNIMYEPRLRQSLKLHMFFKIKFVLYKKKIEVIDGCARG